MKYAIISDIHGNLPALAAVLEDAEAKHVDSFIFLGDYFLSLPFSNKMVNILKETDNAYITYVKSAFPLSFLRYLYQ